MDPVLKKNNKKESKLQQMAKDVAETRGQVDRLAGMVENIDMESNMQIAEAIAEKMSQELKELNNTDMETAIKNFDSSIEKVCKIDCVCDSDCCHKVIYSDTDRTLTAVMEQFEPIKQFNDSTEAGRKEMEDCLKEWQERLFLQDWIIKVKLFDEDLILDNAKAAGMNNFSMLNQTALIKISKNIVTSDTMKFYHEHTLVHELLHCKYNWMDYDNITYEQAYFDIKDHQLLEQMAKSLILAKYNLPLKWFENMEE